MANRCFFSATYLPSLLAAPVALVIIAHRWFSYSRLMNSVRVTSLRVMGASIGVGVRIRPGVLVKGVKNIRIGSNVYIGERSTIVGNGAEIVIGNDVMIAEAVYISTQNHRFRDVSTNINKQGYKNAPVTIEDNVWLGHGAVVLAGSRIQRGSVVGANVVAPRLLREFSIAIPAEAQVSLRDNAAE